MQSTAAAQRATTSRRSNTAYRWVRQLHLWIGAWGALAAVLYGFTGLVMNNRFGANAWYQGDSKEAGELVIEVPAQARISPEALGGGVRNGGGRDTRNGGKGKPAEGRMGKGAVREPAKWSLSGGELADSWSLDYVPGNVTADFKQTRHNTLAVITRLHKGVGGGWAWNLLADSFALGMLLLGLSGLWMWLRGRGPKEVLVSVLALSLAVTALVLGVAAV